jgi:hypothetical protein
VTTFKAVGSLQSDDPEVRDGAAVVVEVDAQLSAVFEPLISKVERRTRHPDRLVFQGIPFVPQTAISWEHLPQELRFGSGMLLVQTFTRRRWTAGTVHEFLRHATTASWPRS